MTRIEIDGNDGTGKSTLVAGLAALGIDASDRGRMTLATDDDSIGPEEGVTYIRLHAPLGVCQNRLDRAGKDLTEQYHTLEDLKHYEERFNMVASRFQAPTINSYLPHSTRQEAVAAILGHPLRLGFPKGRLELSMLNVLVAYGYGTGVGFDRSYRYQGEGLDLFRLKPRAIPQMVAMGFLDAGIVGRDILADSIYDDLVEVGSYGVCEVKIMAAAVRADILTNPPVRPLVVATEFPNIADRWLTELGLAHIILHTGGSTEAYVPEFADLIIDVVDTGDTLEANNLTPLHTFLESDTILITRPELADRLDIRAFAETEFTKATP